MCGDIKPVLTVVANSANVFAGNENDRAQVQQFINMLRRGAMLSGGAVILISHPSLTGIASGSGLSGNTQWHNAVRSRIVMKGIDNKDEHGEPTNDMRVIDFHKNNYGPITAQIVLRWECGVFVPVVGATAGQVERNQRANEVYLEVLHLLVDQGHDLSANKQGGNYAAHKIWDHPKSKEFVKAEMEKAQQRLLDENKIHILREGPPAKQRLRIKPGPRPAGDQEPM
jgi:RecA-family ATPase